MGAVISSTFLAEAENAVAVCQALLCVCVQPGIRKILRRCQCLPFGRGMDGRRYFIELLKLLVDLLHRTGEVVSPLHTPNGVVVQAGGREGLRLRIQRRLVLRGHPPGPGAAIGLLGFPQPP